MMQVAVNIYRLEELATYAQVNAIQSYGAFMGSLIRMRDCDSDAEYFRKKNRTRDPRWVTDAIRTDDMWFFADGTPVKTTIFIEDKGDPADLAKPTGEAPDELNTWGIIHDERYLLYTKKMQGEVINTYESHDQAHP